MATETDASADVIPLEEEKTLQVFRTTLHSVPLWRFELDEAYWWVIPKGVIWGKGTPDTLGSISTSTAENIEEAYQIYLGA